MFFYLSFGRLWCPQHNLQCVSCSVAQLQQPVWWWIWHRVQTETLHSLHLLFFGPIILEKVPVSSSICTNTEGIENRWFISFYPFRQKVCCGIVYKGRFGEVIIDPRLFKPCCSSKKQTLGSTQVATRLPDALPQQLQEDVKESWWLLLLNPPAGLSMASAWHCLQWQTSMFQFLQWNVRFFFSIKCFFLCGYFFTFLYRGDFLFY